MSTTAAAGTGTAPPPPGAKASSSPTAQVVVEQEVPPKIARLRTFLNRPMRLEITDGRIFEGHLVCVDNSKNTILSGAYEISPPNRHARRHLDSGLGKDGDKEEEAPGTGGKDTPVKAPPQLPPGSLEEERRYVGLVMVPGQHIVKAEVDTSHLRTGGVPSSATTSAGWKYDADYLMG